MSDQATIEQVETKRKRGRPRKDQSSEIENQPQTETATKTTSIYSRPYSGRRIWILGVKFDEERRQLPCHGHVAGGVSWQQGSQRQVFDDGYLALDSHRTRAGRALLYFPSIQKAIEQIRNTVVRWQKRPATSGGDRYAAEVLKLHSRHKTHDPQTRQVVPGDFRHTPNPATDVPLAKYLVLIPRKMLEEINAGGSSYEPDLQKIPSMLDLDPTLVSGRLQKSEAWEYEGEDEEW